MLQDIQNYITSHLKRIWLYTKTFWKPLVIFGGIIILILAVKILPFLFVDFTPPPVTVAAQVSKEEEWNKELPAIGELQAVQEVTISPEVGGRVTDIYFQPGQSVKAGDPIIRLNDEQEKADLKRYQSQYDLAKLTLDRSKKLVKNSFESQAELDQKTATLNQSEAQVLQAKATINKKNIVAPFDGILGIRQVDLGQYLEPGTAIVTLTNAKKLFINFARPEHDSKILAVGQKVIVTVDAFPGKEFTGAISTIEPQLNSETRNIKIQATMDNKDLLLAPGMYADIRVILPTKKTQVVVPETAVDFTLYGNAVYVVVENGKDKKGIPKKIVKRHYVKTGDHQRGKVAIIEGLDAGQMVVTSGQIKIDDGVAVHVNDKAELSPPEKLTNY